MRKLLSAALALAIVIGWFAFGSPFGSGTAREADICNERLCLVEIVRTCESKDPKTAVLSFVARPVEGQVAPVSYQVKADNADKLPFMSIGDNVMIAAGIVKLGETRTESVRTDKKTGLEVTISTLGPTDRIDSFTISTDAC